MNKYAVLIVFAGVIFLSTSHSPRAETLLGKDYVGGSYSVVQFGDDVTEDIFGNADGVSAFWNINVHSNVDLSLGFGYSWADGNGLHLLDDGSTTPVDIDLTSISGGGDVIYFFRPDEPVNPYFSIGCSVLNNETDYSGDSALQDEDDTEVGFSTGCGIEYEATEKVLLRAELDFFYIDSEDSVDLSWDAGYWFTERILGMLGASYDLDSKNSVGSVRIILTL